MLWLTLFKPKVQHTIFCVVLINSSKYFVENSETVVLQKLINKCKTAVQASLTAETKLEYHTLCNM